MELKRNDDIKLDIEDMTSEGSAVGHYNGIAVFVRGAVPGDVIIAHIIKTSKRYAIGIIKDIITYSSSRIKSDCPVSEKCGGCSFRNMTYEEELRYKKKRVEDAIERIGHIRVPINEVVGASRICAYRNKAQYPVEICEGELYAGFYAYKSHRIVPCDSCRLQPEEFAACLDAFSEWVRENDITSYNEDTGSGLLRHIYLRRAYATGELMACAVINAESLPFADRLVALLTKIPSVKSICYNVNLSRSNVILGDRTFTIFGRDVITDVLLDKKFEISPASFYQVNHAQCERLYTIAADYANLTGCETVVDLYCGAGTIGLTMSDRAKHIFGIEIVPDAVRNARRNAELNGINNAEFFCGDAYRGAMELQKRNLKPDVVILDPPRKGCQKELFDVISSMSPNRIVYVSCDCATLARDLELLSHKNYEAVEITPVDMFPRTPHIEAVALIRRCYVDDKK